MDKYPHIFKNQFYLTIFKDINYWFTQLCRKENLRQYLSIRYSVS